MLNGHIHQTMQKVEGNIAFHTAMSTAFPQPRPGAAPAPGPIVVPAGQLRDVLGITKLHYLAHDRHLGIVDETLSGASPAAAMAVGEAAARMSAREHERDTAGTSAADKRGTTRVGIDNFAFDPRMIAIKSGQTISWTNRDDVPHRIQSANDRFPPSTVLDSSQSYSVRLMHPGEYPYFCSLHPTMTGKVVVT